MAIGPWSVNPAWQNFSSLYREASTAVEAPTEMEKSHHMTAALYFGIAAIEAFLNGQMRTHLARAKSPEDIFTTLRTGRFLKKLTAWPTEITGNKSPISVEALELIRLCNDIRGDLTHPKTSGSDIYEKLFEIQPTEVVDAVAQYIVAFHQAQGSHYPYWVFGWNYLNPRPDSHEIVLINDQQFCHSLAALGFNVLSYDWAHAEHWKNTYLASVDGYVAIRNGLTSIPGCEPKFDRFPFQPKLCRRWWTFEHHKSCGHVSEQSLANALRFDKA